MLPALAAPRSDLVALHAAGAMLSLKRMMMVVAWGRNLEGQAGIGGSHVVVAAPTPLLDDLHGTHVHSIAASRLTSATVVDTGPPGGPPGGELYTWGDGFGGKLGHGGTNSVRTPARVEALVGRARIVGVGLGDHHAVMLDAHGGVWSCGENKEGQCGLGTPLTVLSQQRHAAFQRAQQAGVWSAAWPGSAHSEARPSPPDAPGGSGGTALARRVRALVQGGGSSGQGRGPARNPGLWSAHQQLTAAQASGLGPDAAAALREAAVRDARREWGGGLGGGGQPSAALALGGADVGAQLASQGAQPGQQMVPARLGRDLHPLALLSTPAPPPLLGPDSAPLPTPHHPAVYTRIAAGRHFSLALDAAGAVWAWGACFNGCLGPSNSWVSSAQRLDGELAAVLEAEGGAVDIAAGGTFCVALTTSGRAVVWGTPPGPASIDGPRRVALPPAVAALADAPAGAGASSGSHAVRLAAGVVPGLPRITHIAAGQQHALLSDGQRVWMLGRAVGQSGQETFAAPWHQPLEVVDVCGDGGVEVLRAGAHASAVVTRDGGLWLWGRLMDATYASTLLRKAVPDWEWADARSGSGAATPRVPRPEAWDWAGHGGPAPARVPGMPGRVRDVALGGWHALAVVE